VLARDFHQGIRNSWWDRRGARSFSNSLISPPRASFQKLERIGDGFEWAVRSPWTSGVGALTTGPRFTGETSDAVVKDRYWRSFGESETELYGIQDDPPFYADGLGHMDTEYITLGDMNYLHPRRNEFIESTGFHFRFSPVLSHKKAFLCIFDIPDGTGGALKGPVKSPQSSHLESSCSSCPWSSASANISIERSSREWRIPLRWSIENFGI
jgi:hypothetical protein